MSHVLNHGFHLGKCYKILVKEICLQSVCCISAIKSLLTLVVATIPMVQCCMLAGHWFYFLTKRLYCMKLLFGAHFFIGAHEECVHVS